MMLPSSTDTIAVNSMKMTSANDPMLANMTNLEPAGPLDPAMATLMNDMDMK